MERSSEHPLAEAIVSSALGKEISLFKVEHFEAIPGKGVMGNIDGKQLAVGNQKLLHSLKIDARLLTEQANALREDGQTVMFVAIENQLAGLLAVSDPVKEMTMETIQNLQDAGLRVIMLTGDNRATAEVVAKKLKIDQVEAEILPNEKAEVVKRLQAGGNLVAMAGDGINDAPSPRPGQCGDCDGKWHGCGHGKCRHHAPQRRFTGYRPRTQPQPGHHAQHSAKFVFCFYIQLVGRTHCGRLALSIHRVCCSVQ